MGKQDLNFIYLCIHDRLLKNSRCGFLPIKKSLEIVSRLYHIPIRFAKVVLGEMVSMKLIVRDGTDYIKILESNIDLEHTPFLYRELILY